MRLLWSEISACFTHSKFPRRSVDMESTPGSANFFTGQIRCAAFLHSFFDFPQADVRLDAIRWRNIRVRASRQAALFSPFLTSNFFIRPMNQTPPKRELLPPLKILFG